MNAKFLLEGSPPQTPHAILSGQFHDDFHVNQKSTTPIQDFWKLASGGGASYYTRTVKDVVEFQTYCRYRYCCNLILIFISNPSHEKILEKINAKFLKFLKNLDPKPNEGGVS